MLSNKLISNKLIGSFFIAFVLSATLLLLKALPAQAIIVNVEPDNFPIFQDLTDAVPGVTLSVAKTTGEPTSTTFNQVVVIEGEYPSTGIHVFGRQIAPFVPDESWFQSGLDFVPAVFRADFSVPTDFVSIDIIDVGSAAIGQLRAFDASDNLLETFTANLNGESTFVSASITRPTADIAYILVAGFPPGGPPFNVVSLDNLQFNIPPLQVSIDIDIKPNDYPNSINLGSGGVVPVAILSSAEFDATTVDPATVNLAGATVRTVGKSGMYLCHMEDANYDLLLDLVCNVETAQFIIEPDATVAVLEAATYDGIEIRGEDSINLVP